MEKDNGETISPWSSREGGSPCTSTWVGQALPRPGHIGLQGAPSVAGHPPNASAGRCCVTVEAAYFPYPNWRREIHAFKWLSHKYHALSKVTLVDRERYRLI